MLNGAPGASGASGATGASECSCLKFRLCLPPLSTSLPSSSAHPDQWQLTGETRPAPHTVSQGTEVGAYGLLGTPASATFAAPVTETIEGYAAPFFLLAPIALALKELQPPTVFPVNSVCTVPVRPDHPCGLPCSAASFCSSSVDCHDVSAAVRSFSPLAPVHLVCPLQFSQFQAELVDYPDKAATAYNVPFRRSP